MRRTGGRGAHRRIGRLVSWVGWVLLLVPVTLVGVAVIVPRAAGATPYTVLTGSMAPAYPPGTLVVVRPVAPEEIGVGDVVTYQVTSGRSAVVTHRVVAVGASIGTGERVLTTRGDANEADDRAQVRPVQVRGTVWYAVPYLGRLATALDGSQRRTALNGVAAGLLLYSAWMFLGAVATRRAVVAPSDGSEAAR